MKQLEDMTLREISDLKEQYKRELAECLDSFFKERPFIKSVTLFRYFSFSNPDCILLFSKETSAKVIANVEFTKESKK